MFLALYAINGLIDKFSHVVSIIAHQDPFSDLAKVRLMVKTEEMRLNSQKYSLSIGVSPSAPTVLLAGNGTLKDNRSRDICDTRDSSSFSQPKVCFNFALGFFHFW